MFAINPNCIANPQRIGTIESVEPRELSPSKDDLRWGSARMPRPIKFNFVDFLDEAEMKSARRGALEIFPHVGVIILTLSSP